MTTKASAKKNTVSNISLNKMAASIAKSHGDEGAIVITHKKDHTRIGVDGLSFKQIQDALCLTIYYNEVMSGSCIGGEE